MKCEFRDVRSQHCPWVTWRSFNIVGAIEDEAISINPDSFDNFVFQFPVEVFEMVVCTRFRDGIFVGDADEQPIAFIVMNVIVHRVRHERGGDNWDTNRDLTVEISEVVVRSPSRVL
jgi:hypothetical protein